jgi:hypothetical protein
MMVAGPAAIDHPRLTAALEQNCRRNLPLHAGVISHGSTEKGIFVIP